MYVHAHLRYCEAMATLGDGEGSGMRWRSSTRSPSPSGSRNARLRQRNAYFSSSDAAFPDRYAASADWERVKAGTIGVDGGWRIYSSGPGSTPTPHPARARPPAPLRRADRNPRPAGSAGQRASLLDDDGMSAGPLMISVNKAQQASRGDEGRIEAFAHR